MALYPDYATLAELRAYVRITDAGDTAEDTHLTAAITAASRAIDQTTKRQFGLAASAVARVYTPYYHETHRRYALDIDDLMTTTSMVVKTDLNDDHTFENTITAYRLWPLNAAGDSRPWTSLVFDSTIPVVLDTGSVEVTAKWGWTAVPDTIKVATLIQASRFYKRRDSPYGVAGSPEMGNQIRLLARVDPDVYTMLLPYTVPYP